MGDFKGIFQGINTFWSLNCPEHCLRKNNLLLFFISGSLKVISSCGDFLWKNHVAFSSNIATWQKIQYWRQKKWHRNHNKGLFMETYTFYLVFKCTPSCLTDFSDHSWSDHFLWPLSVGMLLDQNCLEFDKKSCSALIVSQRKICCLRTMKFCVNHPKTYVNKRIKKRFASANRKDAVIS
jgi:hypothetical protein